MDVIEDVVLQVGYLGRWIQAVGLVVILWIIFQAITMYYNRKRRKLLEGINKRLESVESKLDKFIRKKF